MVATAYVVNESKTQVVYYLPRADYLLIIDRVHTHKCDEVVVELRPIKQSEYKSLQPVLGLKRIKLPDYQSYRCVREVFKGEPKIWSSGYDLTTMSAFGEDQTP